VPDVRDVSYEELHAILAWLQGRPAKRRPTVLLGGWAVYAMNPYAKSRDIDLVLSAKERERLLFWLESERGYTRWRKQQDGWWGAYRVVDPRAAVKQDRQMVVDIASYEETFRFEGRDEHLDFDLALDHSQEVDLEGFRVLVPSPSLLLLYKSKAIWDRTHRLSKGTSEDADYDAEKLVKDKADVLAIIHAAREYGGWDVEFLGEQLMRLPFLVDLIRGIPKDPDAVERFGAWNQNEASRAVQGLLALVT
jgi:hypothetical protein